MQHLTEVELVSHYYHDDDSAVAESHLRHCSECAAQYETIGRVLALVTDAPGPERGEDYGDRVWSRLRWKLGIDRRRRTTWVTGISVAAALAIAFFAGQFWRASRERAVQPTAAVSAEATGSAPVQAAARVRGGMEDKVLLLVVGDHLDSSERVLLELANADPAKGLEIGQESRRAGELVAANRIYRQTAAKNGNERIASVLADLEPVLIELSHAGKSLSKDELLELQKRIEAKGLLFKVRVIGAQTTPGDKPPRISSDTNTL